MTSLRTAARQTFSSLRIRNYRLYFTAQLISVRGPGCRRWPRPGWYSTSPAAASTSGSWSDCSSSPCCCSGPSEAWWPTGSNKRRLLYATQTAGGLLALVLGVLVVTHSVQLWQVYLLATTARRGQRVRQPGPADLRDGDGRAVTTSPTR